MERLRQRLDAAEKALAAFEKLANLKNPNDVERDAAIQRFEFSFEASWKAAKQYLYDIEGVDEGSPKGVIRRCREVHLFKDEEAILALEMVNDRNLTVHTYNEEVAIKIHKNLTRYNNLLHQWVERMNDKVME
ncbi:MULTISPECIES: HI0074 family nucleotidyltransferase substrate-binding subunit [Mesobacillus]|uniref:Nucleotidyltransferase n=2 Tax=Mesobacillus TaxID=2675231 RepID=A0A0D6ZBY8_9BACI|nr:MULTISPECIES: HI0074 family nucleotidyltransferase substrate-binding subunit [Mesobacillus]KIY23062.1 nucleotidyltransferase [Mesobacillus subterraneus]MDQ0415076.1 nucleotidyltransferase substrate binding protein (TIGR01987 family) [Mesobacillus stamsii]